MKIKIAYLNFCFGLFFLCHTHFVQCQDTFRQISVEDGLSNNGITSVVQDSIGFIWVGTKNGLNKYDGSSFKVYHRNNSNISSNDISVLHRDHKNRIWIGTVGGGINVYNSRKDSFEIYRNNPSDKASISSNVVHTIMEDRSGNVWIGTEKGLNLFLEDSKTFKVFSKESKTGHIMKDMGVWCIHEGNSGNLWVGTYGSGLFKFNRETERFTLVSPNQGPKQRFTLEFINTLLALNDDKLLIGTNGNGLMLLDIKTNRISNYLLNKLEKEIPIIRTLQKDHSNNIWVGTDGNGLLKINRDDSSRVSIKQYKNDNRLRTSLANNTVNVVFEDSQSNLWIGTAWKGINILKKKRTGVQFYYSDGKGYNASPVLSIFKDGSNLWLGTDGKGLSVFNMEVKASEEHQSTNRPVGGDFIQFIKKRENGQFWIGFFANGLSLYDPEKGVIKQFKRDSISDRSLPYNDVRDIIELPSGDLWIGSWGGGLSYLEKGKEAFKNYRKTSDTPESISSDNVISILNDDHGVIWIATHGGGLNAFNPEIQRFEHFTHAEDNPESISSNYIFSLLIDNTGNLWLGTKEGLNKFNIKTKTFEAFKIGNTTNSNTIVSLIDDNEGNIWMGTKEGIFKYDVVNQIIEELGGTLKEFHFNSVFKDENGLLFFGGVDGVTSVNPDLIMPNEDISKVVFTDFKLFGQSALIGENRALKDHVVFKNDIVLKYDQSVMTFEFSTLEYPFNEEHYYVKMDGFEENWREIGIRKSTTYTNLSPGDYTFNVRSQGKDKSWNERSISSINIKILPPPWKTWWAYVIYFVALGSILWGVRHYMLIWIEIKNNLKLEKLEREQEDKLHELKQRFFTNISHEIRTPLTLIIGSINNLMQGNFNVKEQKKLAVLKSSTGRLMNLVTELLNIRKLETGNIKLHVSENDMVSFVYEIFLAFSQHAMVNNIDYSFVKPEETVMVWFDKIQLEKTIYNLLTNAFKFTVSGDKIMVKVEQSTEVAKITVQDNGQGIPKNKLSRIFERFYQNEDTTAENLGFGIGLSIAKDLVELHSGTIEVKSILGKGSRFTIILPTGHSHFQREQILSDTNDEDQIINYNKRILKETSSDETFANAKVLIVEDNMHLLEYLKEMLSQDFEVIGAPNGKIGLDLAKEKMPDLIVSDVMMPVMDGISLCYELKTDILTSHIPIILLTARAMVENIMEGFEMGADDYLVKPFHEGVLKVRIKNLLANRRQLREKYTNDVLLNPKEIAFTTPDQEFLSKLNHVIEKNIDVSEFNIDKLSGDMAMSHSNLYKKVKALTGMTTVAFIRDFRLKRAAQLLTQNKFSVIDTCFKVGYTDRRHFSQEFKKKFGKPPSVYANEHIEA